MPSDQTFISTQRADNCSLVIKLGVSRHAVPIERSLLRKSPENGNIPDCCQRFPEISASNSWNWESGDSIKNQKTPPLVGISRPSGPEPWLMPDWLADLGGFETSTFPFRKRL